MPGPAAAAAADASRAAAEGGAPQDPLLSTPLPSQLQPPQLGPMCASSAPLPRQRARSSDLPRSLADSHPAPHKGLMPAPQLVGPAASCPPSHPLIPTIRRANASLSPTAAAAAAAAAANDAAAAPLLPAAEHLAPGHAGVPFWEVGGGGPAVGASDSGSASGSAGAFDPSDFFVARLASCGQLSSAAASPPVSGTRGAGAAGAAAGGGSGGAGGLVGGLAGGGRVTFSISPSCASGKPPSRLARSLTTVAAAAGRVGQDSGAGRWAVRGHAWLCAPASALLLRV